MPRFPLLENMVSLAGLQVINFCLTLAILPFLTRTLGGSAFGEVVFALLIVNYAMWVVNWGFYLGATQRISANRDDRATIEQIFAATWFAQFALTVVVLIGYLACVLILPRFDGLHPLYFAGLTMILGNTLLPIWFLNGLERIKLAATLQIGNKLIALPVILLLVRGPETTWLYLLAMGLAMSITGAITLWIILAQLKIRLKMPHMIEVWHALREDFSLFVGSIIANLNTTVVPAALGVFGSAEALGFYNLADRVRGAAVMVLTPMTHALFPRMCYLFSNDRAGALRLLLVSGVALLAITSIVAVLLFVFGAPILHLLGGSGFGPSTEVLKWLALAPLLTVMVGFATHQIIIPNRHYAIYPKVTMLALAFGAALVLPAIHQFGAPGGAMVTLAAEGLMMLLFWRHILHNRLLASTGTRTAESSSPTDGAQP